MAFNQRKYHSEYYRKHRKALLRKSRVVYAANPRLRKAKAEYRKKWWDRVKTDMEHLKKYVLRKAKFRAKRYGLPFNLSLDDIVIPKTCPIFGFPLRVATGRHDHQSPALDRIIPSKGYVKGNIRVISQRANVLKRDASLAELKKLVSGLIRITH